MAKVPNRQNWTFGNQSCLPITKDKKQLVDYFVRLFFNRTLTIFEYDGLPEELPQRQIELLLQSHAFVVFPKDLIDGKHYAMWGGLGYMPDAYYEPTKAILVNPFLKYNKILDIEKQYRDGECVVIYNDSMRMGLRPTHELYANLLAENIISLRYGTVNARIPALVSADNDITKESAKDFFEKIETGSDYGIIAGTPFFTNLKTDEYGNGANSTHIKELIEEQQYLKSSWWIDLGINSNFNSKREAINESEASMGEDALLPLIDDMLNQRKIGLTLLNKLWGTNITVKFSSAWEKIRKEIKLDEEEQKAVIDSQTVEPQQEEEKSNENVVETDK